MSHFQLCEKRLQPANRSRLGTAAQLGTAALFGLTFIITGPVEAQKVQIVEPEIGRSPAKTTAPAPGGKPAATGTPSTATMPGRPAPASITGPVPTPAQNAALLLDYELLQAAYRGDTVAARRLLARGAKIEVREGQYGFTPLMYAASNGHLGTVRYLLSKGAKVNARSREGIQIMLGTGPTIATERIEHQGQLGQMNWFPVLICESGAVTPLQLASAGGYSLTVRELLAHGADPNLRNPDGDSALMYATFKGYLPSIQALLARGARVNDIDRYGQTALTQAAWTGQLPAVRLLLARKARVNTKARNGWTPIEYARAGGHTAVVRVLRAAAAREPKTAPGNGAAPRKVTGPKPTPNSPVPAPESVRNGSIIIVR